jgi:hypothetical protein
MCRSLPSSRRRPVMEVEAARQRGRCSNVGGAAKRSGHRTSEDLGVNPQAKERKPAQAGSFVVVHHLRNAISSAEDRRAGHRWCCSDEPWMEVEAAQTWGSTPRLRSGSLLKQAHFVVVQPP